MFYWVVPLTRLFPRVSHPVNLRVFLCVLSDTPAISLIAQSENAKVLEDFQPLYGAKTR